MMWYKIGMAKLINTHKTKSSVYAFKLDMGILRRLCQEGINRNSFISLVNNKHIIMQSKKFYIFIK